MRTDNIAEVGMHVFERAGLGVAPYSFVGCYEKVFQACPDAPRQPGASCDYCGTGIMLVFEVRSSDGKVFKVGCNCINKTGDAGLIKAYKNSPEVRARTAMMRHAREDRIINQFLTEMPGYFDSFANEPHPNAYFAAQGKSKADYLNYMWKMNGRTGKAKWAKALLKRRAVSVESDERPLAAANAS